MKRTTYLLLLSMFLFVLCTMDDDIKNDNSENKTETSAQNQGEIESDNTDDDVTLRQYIVKFSDSAQNPSLFIEFTLKSSAKQGLQEGIYTFTTSNRSSVSTPIDVNGQHGKVGEVTAIINTECSSNIYNSSAKAMTGNLQVTKNNNQYLFSLNIIVEKEGRSYEIEAHFCDLLVDYI